MLSLLALVVQVLFGKLDTNYLIRSRVRTNSEVLLRTYCNINLYREALS